MMVIVRKMQMVMMMMMMMMMMASWCNLLLEDLRAAERMKGCPSTPPSALKYQDDGAGDGDDDNGDGDSDDGHDE